MDAKAPGMVHADDLQATARLILDQTEVATALTSAIQATCDTLLRRLDEPVVPGLQGMLDELMQVLRAEKQPPPVSWSRLVGLLVGVALLSATLVWLGVRTPQAVQRRATLMEHVHAVLSERYTALPVDVKTQLTKVYGQQGFVLERGAGGKP